MRLPDWEARLDAVIAAYQGCVFIWGVRDCLRFQLECAEAVTGRRFVHLIPTYHSGVGAALALSRRGFSGLGDVLAAHFDEVAPALARRSDIGVVDEGGESAAVVVLGRDLAGMSASYGLTILPRGRLVRAFAVD